MTADLPPDIKSKLRLDAYYQRYKVLTDTQRETILRTREAYLAGLEGVSEVQEAFLVSLAEARAAGATNQEIGDLLGVSRQRVSQLLKGRGEDESRH